MKRNYLAIALIVITLAWLCVASPVVGQQSMGPTRTPTTTLIPTSDGDIRANIDIPPGDDIPAIIPTEIDYASLVFNDLRGFTKLPKIIQIARLSETQNTWLLAIYYYTTAKTKQARNNELIKLIDAVAPSIRTHSVPVNSLYVVSFKGDKAIGEFKVLVADVLAYYDKHITRAQLLKRATYALVKPPEIR
jgi:hypothetical protein